jgi:predicted PurR-regulated permease PerM
LKIAVGLVAAVLIVAALAQARTVFEPLALALFIIALVWPLQHWLQVRSPKLLALGVTMVITVAVCLTFASLVVWGFGRVGRSLLTDVARYQTLYDNVVTWLDDHGVSVAGSWAEHFNVGWLLRVSQLVTGRLNTTLTFWLITLIYVVLGLLEVDDMRLKAEAIHNREAARVLLQGSAASAAKFRKYMMVRTQMSAITAGRRVRLVRGPAIPRRMGRDRLRAQLHPIHRAVRRNRVPHVAGDDAVPQLASGSRRFHLSQSHPVRDRQLCRAACIR